MKRPALKTYSHLSGKGKVPSEYDIVTTDLAYHVKRGEFEIQTPVGEWFKKYQKGSAVVCPDGDRFQDPRETVYSKYTAIQETKETFVDGLLQSIEDTGYDRALSSEWCQRLMDAFAPLLYPWHGFQMAASYVGAMAPGGRIAIASMFQAADEMRRIQRVAYRCRQLQNGGNAVFDSSGRERWERHPMWQPLRQAVEFLLVTYDWAEAFTALNLCLKPALDGLFMVHFAELAADNGDYSLKEMFRSLNEDCLWSKDWSRVLVALLLQSGEGNRDVIAAWTRKWGEITERAILGLAPALKPMTGACGASLERQREFLRDAGLS